MSTNIDSIKRKLLIKYPMFGSIIVNLEIRENLDIETAGTDGKVIFYNPTFLENLSEKQQTFIFAHEICHVAFEHMYRSEGKDKRLWNIATDSVINALLKQDGLPLVEGGVDIPEAKNYDAEEMYNKLLREKKKQEQQNQQGNKGQQMGQDSQKQQDSQGSQGKQNSQEKQEQQNSQGNQGGQNSQRGQKETDVGHDTHSLWEKAIEERKKEQQEQGSQEEQQKQDSQKNKEKQNLQNQKEENAKEQEEKNKRKVEENSKFAKQGERETFKQNKIERRKRLQELSKELAKMSSHQAGDEIQRERKKLSDIGIATPLIDWRRLLRQAIKYDEEYTRKNARMRNGYFRYKLEQIPIPETEIVLDTSGSVSEILLKNFLRECKNILYNSKVKVGCFNTEFHGFTEIRKPEDIDNMSFPIGGGTNFDVAVKAFSKKVPNKIIFTDGEADMPKEKVKNVIWIVYGNRKINPEGGKVINITGEQLERLYQSFIQDKDDIIR